MDWNHEAGFAITTVSVQVGEAPIAYRATWEVRDGYAQLVQVARREQRPGDDGGFGPWGSLTFYPAADRAVAAILTDLGRRALARFGIDEAEVTPVSETLFDA